MGFHSYNTSVVHLGDFVIPIGLLPDNMKPTADEETKQTDTVEEEPGVNPPSNSTDSKL